MRSRCRRKRMPEPFAARDLYVHAPHGRAGRAIDAATEAFVDATRMGASP